MTTKTKYAKRNKKANFTTPDPIRDGRQTLYIRVQCLPFGFAFAKPNKRRTTAIRGGYCNNGQVNWVDLWGLNAGDVTVLFDTDGVWGAGHSGIMVTDKNKSVYYAKEGYVSLSDNQILKEAIELLGNKNITWSNGAVRIVGSSKPDVFATLAELEKRNNELLQSKGKKYEDKSGGMRYEESFTFNVNANIANTLFDYLDSNYNTDYDFFDNNCGTLVYDSLYYANILKRDTPRNIVPNILKTSIENGYVRQVFDKNGEVVMKYYKQGIKGSRRNINDAY